PVPDPRLVSSTPSCHPLHCASFPTRRSSDLTLRAHTELVRQLQARTVKRDYLALVHGVVKQDGEVSAPLGRDPRHRTRMAVVPRSEEHTSELQSRVDLVCRLLLEKKK